MTAAPTHKKVYVQQAIDEAVYFVPGEITYDYVSVVAPGEELEQAQRIVFIRFTPTNGSDMGREHSVPFSRVIAIVNDG